MSPVVEVDQKLEQVIRQLALRILAPRWTQFDAVWEAAIRVCDRYELGKNRATSVAVLEKASQEPESITSSPESSVADAPVQTHPPIAA